MNQKTQNMIMMGMMMMLMIVALIFVGRGLLMHFQVPIEEAKFHALQQSYWSIDKVTRDGAATGSDLNNTLVQIKNYPSTLLELKLIGVGQILAGIFVLLFGILIALIMMPVRLGKIIKGQDN